MRKAHNSQVAASCHLRIAFDMWWLYYHKGCIYQVWPCPEKDMGLLKPRVSAVVRTQTAPDGVRRLTKMPQVPAKTV